MAGNDVRTFHRDTSSRDNAHIARARVDLKLAALAYGQSRHGSDGGIGMARAGMGMLCQAAVRYAEALLGRPIPLDPTLHLDEGM